MPSNHHHHHSSAGFNGLPAQQQQHRLQANVNVRTPTIEHNNNNNNNTNSNSTCQKHHTQIGRQDFASSGQAVVLSEPQFAALQSSASMPFAKSNESTSVAESTSWRQLEQHHHSSNATSTTHLLNQKSVANWQQATQKQQQQQQHPKSSSSLINSIGRQLKGLMSASQKSNNLATKTSNACDNEKHNLNNNIKEKRSGGGEKSEKYLDGCVDRKYQDNLHQAKKHDDDDDDDQDEHRRHLYAAQLRSSQVLKQQQQQQVANTNNLTASVQQWPATGAPSIVASGNRCVDNIATYNSQPTSGLNNNRHKQNSATNSQTNQQQRINFSKHPGFDGIDDDDDETSEGQTRKKKYLTAKYGQQQMNLIKKRLKIEMWLHEQLNELAKQSTLVDDEFLDEVDIDLDQLLDMDDDHTRRAWLKRTLEPLNDIPAELIDKFICQVLEQSKLL